MNSKDKKTDSSKASKRAPKSKIGELKELIAICSENKITQLKLPDGTSILMHELAFYGDGGPQKLPSQGEFPTTNDLDSDIMDEDTLFMSAR